MSGIAGVAGWRERGGVFGAAREVGWEKLSFRCRSLNLQACKLDPNDPPIAIVAAIRDMVNVTGQPDADLSWHFPLPEQSHLEKYVCIYPFSNVNSGPVP